MLTKFTNRASVMALAAALAATGAYAQDGDDDSPDDRLTVTAQKREETVVEVPISVGVLPADVIENQYAVNIENLQTLVPSISFRKGSTNANSGISMRGIGTISFSLAAEPSVATVVDGVVLGRSGQAFGDLYDLERIEVLRGPQGTLFGKNASAGVLNIVTQRPSETFEGYVSGTIFEDNETLLRGRISGPLGENARGSLSLSKSDFDGNIRNVFNNEDVNGYDRFSIRGMLETELNDRVSALFIAEHYEADDDCCADLEVLPSDRNPNSPAAPDSQGVVNGVADLDLDQRNVDHDFETRTLDESDSFSAQFDIDIGNGFTLTSITAYRQWENTEFREGDFTSIGGTSDQPVFGVPFQLHDDGTRTFDQVTQEIRLTSPEGQRLEYILGAYYYSLEGEADFTRNASCQNNGGQNQPILDANPGLTCNANDIVSATGFFNTETVNYALFGNSTFEVIPGLEGIFGFRYADDDISFVYTRRNNDPFGRQGVGVRPAEPNSQFGQATGGFDNTFINETENEEFVIRAGASADLGALFGNNANLGSTYFTYNQGYKGPAFNVFYNMGTNDTVPVDAETTDAFEIGYKFDNGSFFLSAAAYYAEIENFQANNFDNSTGVTITRFTNAGDVITQGIEIDATWTPIDNLSLFGSLALNEAEIDQFNVPIDPTTGQPETGFSNLSGFDLLFSPDFNYTFGGNYTVPLANGDEIVFNTTFAHVDEQQSGLPSATGGGSFDPVLLLPSYDLWDAQVTYRFGDAYSISLIGKNLLDESFVTTFSGDGFRYQIPRDADRRFGINFRADF